jgi:hypothetical protein
MALLMHAVILTAALPSSRLRMISYLDFWTAALRQIQAILLLFQHKLRSAHELLALPQSQARSRSSSTFSSKIS